MAAADLVEQAIEAHGGLERYRSAGAVTATIRSGGLAFAMRFKRKALAHFEGRIATEGPRTVLSPYPGPGRRGIFERDRVWIESESGEVLAERQAPRAAFRGVRRNPWWDHLDLLHFAGYALWNYLSTPFMFKRDGFELEEREPWTQDGERWRRLHVTFPDDIPTHSREQDFYFDERGLLRRLDYTAEVFGNWAKAAHVCWDHKSFDGLVVPTCRRVTPRRRNDEARRRPVLVWIAVDGLQISPSDSAATTGPTA
jgi:hypothetical protein